MTEEPPLDEGTLELVSLADGVGPRAHDWRSQKTLRQIVDALRRRPPTAIARLAWDLDGTPLRGLAGLLKTEHFPGKVRVRATEPVMERVAWDFTTPLSAVVFDAKGAGRITYYTFTPHADTPWSPADPGSSEPCVVRFSVREAYVPMSLKQEEEQRSGKALPQPPFDLFSPAEFSRFVTHHGVVPLRVGLLAYTTKSRHVYDLDFVNNLLVRDHRGGRMSVSQRVVRSTRLYHSLDRFVARRTLPVVPNRILELLFETDGLSPSEVGKILEISRDLASASLDTLVARQKAILDRSRGIYLPLPQSFLAETEAAHGRHPHHAAPPAHHPAPSSPAPVAPRAPEPVTPAPAPVPTAPPTPRPEEPAPAPVTPPSPVPPVAPTPSKPATDGGETGNVKDSVEKILKLIESHPTCPVCGQEMPPDSTELVCPRCLQEMGG